VKIFKIYEAGAVRRYHAKRVLVDQTIADHSWGVCVVLMWLYFPDLPPAKLFQMAVLHDVPEVITGDVPAPAKWRSLDLRTALAALELEVADELGIPGGYDDPTLAFADNAELVMHSLCEMKMGNHRFLQTAARGLSRMRAILMPSSELQTKGALLIKELTNEADRR